jgi:hypothetical protein
LKFFTINWWNALQERTIEEDAPDDTFPAYARHLESIRANLPPDLLALTESASLHDSSLREADLDTQQKQLRFRLDGDDGLGGLCRFELLYSGVSLFRIIYDPEIGFPGPHADWGYDEADIGPAGEVEHRILFSSGIEFLIRFSDLQVTKERPLK